MNGLNAISDTVCSSPDLKVLHLWEELQIIAVPHCLGNMTSLQAIWIDYCPSLRYIPLSLFSLPNLVELSLYHLNITHHALLEYNDVNEVATNYRSEQTKYWFSLNPICDENQSAFSSDLTSFLSLNDSCTPGYGLGYERVCPMRLVGDGLCQYECYFDANLWDKLSFRTSKLVALTNSCLVIGFGLWFYLQLQG